MKRPEFTREQEDWICYAIGEWYLQWKNGITSPGIPHNFGFAKEDLKMLLFCGDLKEGIERE